MIIGSGKIAHRQPVALGRLAKKVHPRHAAGASHVLHDKRRIAGDMLGQMTRDDSSFDICGTAGSKVNDEVYAFTLVKWPFRRNRWSDKKKQTEKSQDELPPLNIHSQSSFSR